MSKKILFMTTKFVPVSIVLIVTSISKNGFSLWMQKREEKGDLNNLWEFPGGKIEPNETPKDAACREFREEVGIDCPKIEEFKVVSHSYNDRKVLLNIFYARSRVEELPISKRQKTFFVNFQKEAQLLEGKMLAANHNIVESFSNYIQSNLLLKSEDSLCLLS